MVTCENEDCGHISLHVDCSMEKTKKDLIKKSKHKKIKVKK